MPSKHAIRRGGYFVKRSMILSGVVLLALSGSGNAGDSTIDAALGGLSQHPTQFSFLSANRRTKVQIVTGSSSGKLQHRHVPDTGHDSHLAIREKHM